MFNCLELFSGTGSFGKVAKDMGYNVLSIDLLLDADINMDIMDWDYKSYPQNSFDIIWASPPCTEYSRLQDSWIGRMRKGKIYTKEQQEIDMNEADKLVKRTLDIINYFNPHLYYIENPLGRLKDREIMKNIPYYIVDYCMYSDWGYRKRTCIWTNKKNWNPLICNKKCGNMVGNLHKTNLGNTERRLKTFGHPVDLHKKYRVPAGLIFSLLSE